MTREEVLTRLRAANPGARADRVTIYADALVEYKHAQANITENGSIVLHPRTGAPIENPYIKIRNQASKVLLSIGLHHDGLWN